MWRMPPTGSAPSFYHRRPKLDITRTDDPAAVWLAPDAGQSIESSRPPKLGRPDWGSHRLRRLTRRHTSENTLCTPIPVTPGTRRPSESPVRAISKSCRHHVALVASSGATAPTRIAVLG